MRCQVFRHGSSLRPRSAPAHHAGNRQTTRRTRASRHGCALIWQLPPAARAVAALVARVKELATLDFERRSLHRAQAGIDEAAPAHMALPKHVGKKEGLRRLESAHDDAFLNLPRAAWRSGALHDPPSTEWVGRLLVSIRVFLPPGQVLDPSGAHLCKSWVDTKVLLVARLAVLSRPRTAVPAVGAYSSHSGKISGSPRLPKQYVSSSKPSK